MHQQQTALENIVGKEEIARNEQFLLLPQCFLLMFWDTTNVGFANICLLFLATMFSKESNLNPL